MSRQYKTAKDVPDNVLAKRLRELSRAITDTGSGSVFPHEFYMRIPAEPDHDADLVMHEAARRLEGTA